MSISFGEGLRADVCARMLFCMKRTTCKCGVKTASNFGLCRSCMKATVARADKARREREAWEVESKALPCAWKCDEFADFDSVCNHCAAKRGMVAS